jgi:PAS domain S-box-containing protein
MLGENPEIIWALTIGTLALIGLIAVFIATILFSQRKFITIRRESLDSLQRSEERFRSLIEHSSDAIALLSDKGVVSYASPSTSRVIGFAAEECVGKSFYAYMNPDEIAALQQSLLSSNLGVESAPIEFRYNHKSGKQVWLEGICTNLLDDPNVCAVVFNYRDITHRKEAEQELRVYNEQLRRLSARLQSIREEERTRISREVHDEVGGFLTVLKMDVAVVERKLGTVQHPAGKDLGEELNAVSARIDRTIQSVRRIAHELRPGVLDAFGLEEAIETELNLFQLRTAVTSRFVSKVEKLRLNDEQATALFRIFQESLTNVIRHARASEVDVVLSQFESSVRMEIHDNGVGIPAFPSSRTDSLGLLGMRERARMIGGGVAFEGGPGKGTTVSVLVPLNLPEQNEHRLAAR